MKTLAKTILAAAITLTLATSARSAGDLKICFVRDIDVPGTHVQDRVCQFDLPNDIVIDPQNRHQDLRMLDNPQLRTQDGLQFWTGTDRVTHHAWLVKPIN